MIRRLELVNFMSHARTVIEPAEGLTVLVGPNNCGKSAVVAALQILCHNETSTYVMRHNERECSVTVETSDGNIVQWSRRNGSPRYTINSQVFDRLERNSIPDGLHTVLRLPKVTADGNREFDLHFGEQKSPVFLIDKPGSHAAQFFASSSDAARLVEMQKRHQQKMAEARRERIRLEPEAACLSHDLSILAAAGDLGPAVEQAEAAHSALGELGQTVAQIQADTGLLEKTTATLQARRAEAESLETLRSPPTLEPTEPIAQVIDQLTRTTVRLDCQSALSTALAGLHPAPELEDEQALAALIEDLFASTRTFQRLDAECAASRQLSVPPTMDDTNALDDLLRDIVAVVRRAAAMRELATVLEVVPHPPLLEDGAALADEIKSLRDRNAALNLTQSVCGCLMCLEPPPALMDLSELSGLADLAERTQADVSANVEALATITPALQQAELALQRWAKEQYVCPTCGGQLDPARIAEHVRTHTAGAAHA